LISLKSLIHEQMLTAVAIPFKQCTRCGSTWTDCTDFLSDPAVILRAYQVSFEELEAGIFLFEHSCKASLSIVAGDFSHLYEGPVFEERATGTDECPGYCLKRSNFERCPVRCECAYIREVLQIIKIWPKNAG
jgi:hypothetical protein